MAEKEITVWQFLNKGWDIKKTDIKNKLDINPNQPWENISLSELYRLSDFLDVTVGDIVD